MSTSKAIIATRKSIDGFQRKLAWFSRHKNGLYFEVAGFFMGSHTSYHTDGNVFRTSPATGNRAKLSGRHLRLDDFHGWYQLGMGMVLKAALSKNPQLRDRNRGQRIALKEIDTDEYPSTAINLVVELVSPDYSRFLSDPSVAPPNNANVLVLDCFHPFVVVTVLGHDDNLLIRPKDKGFVVSHFNSRYTANASGRSYQYEAYKDD